LEKENCNDFMVLLREGRAALMTGFGLVRFIANYAIQTFVIIIIAYTVFFEVFFLNKIENT
jgi:hypothetical protein